MIQLRHIEKHYDTGESPILALDDVSLDVPDGQMCALMGPSGAGKSTMLHVLAGLAPKERGEISVGGVDLASMSRDELTVLRRRSIGVVFQFFNLLPYLTARENIALPLRLDNVDHSTTEHRVSNALEMIELCNRSHHFPSQLSGGEMQRVAIARALVIDPVLLLADEPTGNLDATAGRLIMSLLKDINERTNVTMLIVTHDPIWASFCDRVVRMVDGRVDEDVDLSTDVRNSSGVGQESN